ncbi:membrane protein [Streptomyces europaeiscabiei]|nr:membrane protein [Streptomyces europaeiscabiei]
MSSSDQQYPYPYDPERQQQPAQPHWPDGTAGQSAVPQEPAAFDQGATQTWQAPTWDTQYQPTIRPDGEPHRAQGQGQGQGYGQPQQPNPYGTPQPDPYGQHQQPGPYGTPEPHPPYQQQYQEPQHQPQYQEPQQPYRPPAADTAYLPPQGASGSFPLPPEVPAVPVAPVAPATPVSAAVPVTARPEAGDTGYSAPTTLGNARITDAQRARAEGRSPIIAPGMQPAALTAVLGLLLAGGAAIGPYALLVPVVLLQAVTAAGWFRLNGMWPARQGIALAFAGGLVADVVLLAAGREHGPAALLGTLGVWVLLTVVLQLRSHAGADERMYGLMATVVSASLAVLAGGHLAAVPDAVVVGGVAVAAATLVRALPLPGAASVAVALLAGVGAGLTAGNATDIGAKGALLGLAAAGCALIGLRVASYDYPSRFVHMTAGVALPLAAAAPAVYLVGRAIA